MKAVRVVVLVGILLSCEASFVHAAAAYNAQIVLQYTGVGAFLGCYLGLVTGTLIGCATAATAKSASYTQDSASTSQTTVLFGLLAGSVAGVLSGILVGRAIGWRYGLYKVHGVTPFPLLDFYRSRRGRAL